MGTIPGQDVKPAITCMSCGRKNPADGKYCQYKDCNQPLHSLTIDKLRAALQAAKDAQDENLELRQKHDAAQDENQQLRQQVRQLQPLEEEVGRLKATTVDPDHVAALISNLQTAEHKATALESHALGLKGKLESAEQRAAELESKLAAKAKEFEEIDILKARSVDPAHVATLTSNLQTAEQKAADLESHVAGWKSKWQSAEQKAEALKSELAAKVREVEELFNRKSEATSVDPAHVAALTTNLQTAVQKADALESQVAGWKSKSESSEQKAAILEANLAVKAKDLAELIKKNGGIKPIPYLKSIIGIMTLMGSLAGYGTGRYVQPKNDASGRINQLVAQVASAQQQVGQLKSALKAAIDKPVPVPDPPNPDLGAANQQTSDLTARLKQMQRQLNETIAQKDLTANQIRNQSKAELDAANHKIGELSTRDEQLQHQLSEAVTQRAANNETLNQRDAQIATLTSQLAPSGSLIWSGNLAGKRTIDIKNGVPDFGTVSGVLPPRLCKVSTQDSRVKIKTHPSKNHLGDFSFEVSGSGLVQVRIDWEVSHSIFAN